MRRLPGVPGKWASAVATSGWVLSPIDLPRRKSFRQLLSPPPVFPTALTTTPDPLPIMTEMEEINLDEVDTSTPETDRLGRGGGVQRRLFGGQTSSPSTEQTSQEKGQNT